MAIDGGQVQRGAVQQGELLGHIWAAGGAQERRALVWVPSRLPCQLCCGRCCFLQCLMSLRVPNSMQTNAQQ